MGSAGSRYYRLVIVLLLRHFSRRRRFVSCLFSELPGLIAHRFAVIRGKSRRLIGGGMPEERRRPRDNRGLLQLHPPWVSPGSQQVTVSIPARASPR